MYKEIFIGLLKEANEATQEEDEAKKKSCKEKFLWFAKGAGKVLDKALGALANLAKIASFFGLGAP